MNVLSNLRKNLLAGRITRATAPVLLTNYQLDEKEGRIDAQQDHNPLTLSEAHPA